MKLRVKSEMEKKGKRKKEKVEKLNMRDRG